MLLNLKTVKLVSVFSISAFILFFYNISLAQEQATDTKTLTKVEIKDVKIGKSDTEIKISGMLFNPSSKIETAPFATLILLENNANLTKGKYEDIVPPFLIVSAKEDDSFLTLKPQESKEVNFSLPISRYAPNGNYRFSLQAINQYGEVLGRYSAALRNIGANQASQGKYKNGFLAFDYNNCKIVNADGKEFNLNEGPIFNPSQQPLLKCAITNVGNETITAYPSMEWKEYLVYGRPSDTAKKIEKYATPIIFKANETKKVEILLPKADKSQVYQALLSFADSEGVGRSFNSSLRWTIGGSSARVDKVSLVSPLKNIYEKGETVSLSADYFGSMDLYWSRGDNKMISQNNVKLNATIKDSKGGECGRVVKSLPDISDGSRRNEIMNVVLEKQCEGISYSVSFSSQDKVLSNASGRLPQVAEENKAVNYKEIGIILFFIVVFLAFLFIQMKKKVAAKISLFCLFLGASFIFTNSVSAKPYGGSAGYNGDWGGVSTDISDIFYLGHGHDKPSENYSTFKVKDSQVVGLGYSIGIDFSDLSHPQMDVAYKVGDNGCGNVHSVYFRVSVQSETTDSKGTIQKDVPIRDLFSNNGTYKDSKTYAVSQTAADFQVLEIDPSVMNDFYYSNGTGGYNQRSNPKLIVTIQTAVDRDETGGTQFRRGAWGAVDGTVYSLLASALDASAKAIYTIPLNLPEPSVSLSAVPSSVSAGGSADVTLNTTDLSKCQYNNNHSAIAGENGFDSLIFDSTPSNGTKSQKKTVSNLWITTSNQANQDNQLNVECIRDLGNVGTGKYIASATVTVKPPASSSSSSSSSSSPTGCVGNCNPSSSSSSSGPSTPSSSSSSSQPPGGSSPTLTVNASGNGEVSVEEGGSTSFTCRKATCSKSYSLGASLTLTATKDSGASFSGWSGSCSGTGDCLITMDGDKAVNASFTPDDGLITSSSSSPGDSGTTPPGGSVTPSVSPGGGSSSSPGNGTLPSGSSSSSRPSVIIQEI